MSFRMVVIIEFKSIHEYLNQMEEMGEDCADYDGLTAALWNPIKAVAREGRVWEPTSHAFAGSH